MMPKMLKRAVGKMLSPTMRADWLLRSFAFTKIPALAFFGPRVVSAAPDRLVVRIPLNWRTRNHERCMYMGVLAAGADAASAIMALLRVQDSGLNMQVLFKDLHADYRRRVEGDCYFTCDEGAEITQLIDRAASSGKRESSTVNVNATVPSIDATEIVASFQLTLSVKLRG